MFTGILSTCPVAYDAFSTGISGKTLAMPIASTPPFAPSLEARAEPGRAPLTATGLRRGERFASQATELAHVAEVRFPPPIGHEFLREPNGVVVSVDQLVDQEREIL